MMTINIAFGAIALFVISGYLEKLDRKEREEQGQA